MNLRFYSSCEGLHSVKHIRPAAGFTLLETLVAMSILVFGLTGFVALLLAGLKNDRNLLLQTRAIQYAESMAEVIRSGIAVESIGYGVRPGGSADCTVRACNPQQMAVFETSVWKCQLSGEESDLCSPAVATSPAVRICRDWQLPTGCSALPSGDGRISVQAGVSEVSVRWRSTEKFGFNQVSLRIRQ